MKDLIKYIKLNSKQRRLHKVGIVDGNGNLTEEGGELLLNVLLEDYTDRLVDLTKEFKKDETSKEVE